MKNKFVLDHKGTAKVVSSALLLTATAGLSISNMHVPRQHAEIEQTEVISDSVIRAACPQGYTSGYVTYTLYNPSNNSLVSNKSDNNLESEDSQSVESIGDSTPSVMYVDTENCSNLNVRQSPSLNSEVIGQLENADKVIIQDIDEDTDFAQISFNNTTGYIHSSFLSETEPEVVDQVSTSHQSSNSSEGSENSNTIEYNQDDDLVLNSYIGTVDGPSGKETYYNLNMSHVVEIMHDMNVEGEYWVRDDGVKCLGEYVMVAADLDIHPRGSLVETSLGTGVVCDTGEFVEDNSTQLDIAVDW